MTKPEREDQPQDVVRILLYLYSVVMALALKTSVTMTIAPEGQVLSLLNLPLQRWAVFGAFFFTLVPFYHGASLHILRTYRDRARRKKKGEALIDFFVLAIEAVIFSAMATSLNQLEIFVVWFGALLVLDSGWVGFTYYKSGNEAGEAPRWWAGLNGAMLLALVLMWEYVQTEGGQVHLVLLAASLIRTFTDYWKCYRYYFPFETNKSKLDD